VICAAKDGADNDKIPLISISRAAICRAGSRGDLARPPSHEPSLVSPRGHNQPARQIASRELEIVRIKTAMQRTEELNDDVAAAIEGVL
jgi:hypothetical protein